MSQELICREIGKLYGARAVLQDVEVKLTGGEISAVLGPNGAGKTTLFSILSGNLAPDRGSVLVDGVEVTHLSCHQRVALGVSYLPQRSSVFQKADVWRNLTMIRLALGDPPSEVQQRADSLLTRFGLVELKRIRADKLSGGERRRLEIARALMSEPRYLLLDEPFAGLDPVTIEQLHQLLKQLCREGIGVLLTDHNVGACLNLAERGYILIDGRVCFQGEARGLAENPQVKQHYLGATFRG